MSNEMRKEKEHNESPGRDVEQCTHLSTQNKARQKAKKTGRTKYAQNEVRIDCHFRAWILASRRSAIIQQMVAWRHWLISQPQMPII